jgi:signal transduction histidine kinase
MLSTTIGGKIETRGAGRLAGVHKVYLQALDIATGCMHNAFAALLLLILVTPIKAALLKHVVMINSYHEGYAWTDSIVRGVRRAFESANVPVDLDIEYLDQRRHEDEESAKNSAEFFKRKFAHTPVDLVIASDDLAVRFLLKRHDTLFSNVPMVFCGVNEFHGSSAYVSLNPEARPWLTGVLETVDVDSTVDIALRLNPDTRSLVTIGEDSATYYDRDLKRTHPELSVSRIPAQDLPLDELGKQLGALKPHTIVLVSYFSRDSTGHWLSIEDSIRFVCEHSPVPVYGLNWTALGLGIVGGKLTDGYEQGRRAGTIAISVLKGASTAALGIQRDSPNTYAFDYAQLSRFGIPVSLVPAGSVIINRPKSFYAVHPVWVWGGASFVLVESFVIALLLIQRRRRRKAERSLALQAEQLRRSNYVLKQFAYVTAHDFQEPIRNVAIFTELLRRTLQGKLNADAEQAMNYALLGAKRMHAMLHGLLDWVKATDDPGDDEPSSDSASVLNRVLEAHKVEIENSGAIVTTGKLPTVPMYEEHLARVWENLLSNAIQYRGNEPLQITISADQLPNEWRFSIRDNGPGIDHAFHERIFGVFKRLDRTVDSRIGMGLAICRRIVDHYGGRIWVDSEEGRGATFYFTIPDETPATVLPDVET